MLKRQVAEARARLTASEEARDSETRMQSEVIEQLRAQVKNLRRDQSDKENELYEYKEMVKKCDIKNQTL